MNSVEQFDIYLTDLNPHIGIEQAGVRPCLILQTNAVSQVARTFLIAPLTTKQLEHTYPYQVRVVKSNLNGLLQDSKIELDQLRVIDKKRLIKKLGSLEVGYHPVVFQALDVMIDRFGDFRKTC